MKRAVWFDAQILIPPALASDDRRRRLFEQGVAEKMARDIDAKGLEPLPSTFRILWSGPLAGRASLAGVPGESEP